jgi:hypothetical protein
MVPDGIFRPTLSLGAGRFAEGNASRIIQWLVPGLGEETFALARVAHDFVDAHVGFEIGSPTGASFFLRGGLSRNVLHLPALRELLSSATADSASLPSSATMTVTTPSAQLGLVVYLW